MADDPVPRDDPATGGPPPGAVGALMRFSTQMHGVGTRFATRESLHPTDVQAMAILAAAGRALTAGELATELELSTGATTRLVDRLERVGHLARAADPHDGRRRLISITPGARATAGAYFGQLGRHVQAVLDRYGPDEVAVIERFLDDLVIAMADLSSPGPPVPADDGSRDDGAATPTAAPTGPQG